MIMMERAAEDHWVHWWCNPWQWAHPDWQSRFAAECGLTVEECDALMVSRHSVFLQRMGIAPQSAADACRANVELVGIDTRAT